MFGSIFYNCWASLFAFSAYFFMALNKPYLPSRILLGAFVSALIVFLVTFAIRFLIAFILYNPEGLDDAQVHDENDVENNQLGKQEQGEQSTEEFSEEATEEVAQVVKTLLHTE